MSGKRSNGEGYITKTQSGKWRGQVMDGYTDLGKRNIVPFYADSKSEVLRQIHEYQSQKEANIHINRNMTFNDWGEKWYKDYKGQVQESTYCNYKYTLKILKENLKTRKLNDILPMDINEMINNLRDEEYSMSQIRKCRAMLIQIFDAADDNGLIARNPARRAKKIRENGRDLSYIDENAKDAFSVHELEVLFSLLPDNLMGHSIRLLISTGIRVQELLALTPNDIAEDGSMINVNKAIKTVNGVSVLGSPKSKKGIRKVPVPEESREHAIYLRQNGGSEFIWTASRTAPLYGVGTFRRQYYKTIEQIEGVRKLSPHCCRHTYITILQAKGVPMETIARLVGHSDISTTDEYLHISTDTLKKSVEQLKFAG